MVEQQRLKPNGEFRFARGWFIVAPSCDVTPGKSHRLFFFGRKMVAFRNADGSVSVLDAVCPHMGAELGIGGVIDEGGVRCPYHHWRFGPDGKCNDVPYCDTIPPRARVHSYPVREINGVVLVWHDPELGEPDFEIEELPEYNDPQWVKWDIVRRDIHSVPLELLDNLPDVAHFGPVHQSVPDTFENRFEGHKAWQIQTATHETLAATPGGVMTSTTFYTGPGWLLTHHEAKLTSWMNLSNTPIDDENMAIWFGMMVKADGPITPEFMKMRDEQVANAHFGASQDIVIWENKTLVDNPMLCRNDGPILKAREWYRQFLRPRKEVAQEAAE
jgi:3-ketosteroid 9alpha-monooxygenase subunit A